MHVWKLLPAGLVTFAVASIALVGVGYTAPVPSSVAHQCGLRYQAARNDGTLAGRKWPQFFSECSTALAEASDTTDARKDAAAGDTTDSAGEDSGKRLSPSQVAFRERIHECSREWHRDKAANRLKGQKWPQYWSACNTRLKQED